MVGRFVCIVSILLGRMYCPRMPRETYQILRRIVISGANNRYYS